MMIVSNSQIILSNLYAAYESVRDYKGVSFVKSPCFSSVSNKANGWPNFVFDIQCSEIEFDNNLNEIAENIKAENIPAYLVFDNEQLTTSVLDSLAVNNFINVEQWVGMSLKLNDEKAFDTEQFSVQENELVQWQEFVSEVLFPKKNLSEEFCSFLFHNNCFRLLHIKDGVKTVASAMLYIDGETAGLFMVATHPDYRKSGLGTQITEAAIQVSRHSGCKQMVLQSTRMGLPLYQKCGFKSCNDISIFWLANKKFI